MLEARGIDYELIQYEKRRTLSEKIMSVPRLLNGVLLNDKYEALKKKMGMKKHPEFAKNDAIRMEAFGRFKKKAFTRFSPVFAGYPALCEGAKRYDAVVTGSDQLWSPAGLPTNYYNLMFGHHRITLGSIYDSRYIYISPVYHSQVEFLFRIVQHIISNVIGYQVDIVRFLSH